MFLIYVLNLWQNLSLDVLINNVCSDKKKTCIEYEYSACLFAIAGVPYIKDSSLASDLLVRYPHNYF